MNPQNQKPEQNPERTGLPPEVPVYPSQPPPVQARPQEITSPEQQFVRQQVGDPDRVKHPRFRTRAWQNFFGFFGVVQLLVVALFLAFFINQFVFQSYQVFGESMAPTLHEGDRLVISKLGKTWAAITSDDYVPKRGEIIVFSSTQQRQEQLVKRVVGIPGDRVVVERGEVRVFNADNLGGFDPDDEVSVDFVEPTLGSVDITVGEGQLFVLGDNRSPDGSLDSRFGIGLVPIEDVSGTLIMRIFPLSNAELF